MMPPPMVSVLTTVFNGMPFIRQAMQAILSQQYPCLEVVVVDDGSTDGTTEFLQSLSDSRVKFIQKGKLGRGKALNEGLAHCTGKYVAINDADDISLPQRLEKQVAFLESNADYGMVGTHSYLYDFETGQMKKHYRPTENEMIRRAFTKGQPIQHVTVLFRKSILDQVGGYNECIPFLFDRDIFLRVAQISKVANLPDYLVKVGHHSNRYFYFHYKGLQREWLSLRYKIKAINLFGFSKVNILKAFAAFGWALTPQFLRTTLISLLKNLRKLKF